MATETELAELAITLAERRARGLIGERRQHRIGEQPSRFQSRLIYPSIQASGDTANGGATDDGVAAGVSTVDAGTAASLRAHINATNFAVLETNARIDAVVRAFSTQVETSTIKTTTQIERMGTMIELLVSKMDRLDATVGRLATKIADRS